MNLIEIFQFKNGYRYNTDSLLIADFALKSRIFGEVLDIGAGCGILGILLKKFEPKININFIDLQEQNIKLIEKNLEKNQLFGTFFCEDFANFSCEKKFDFIISNPPFYHTQKIKSQNEHEKISKFEDFLPLESLIKNVANLLKPRGKFCFCFESYALSRLCVLLEKYKLKITKIRFVHAKVSKKARLILIEARKNVKSQCEILPPFFGFENETQSAYLSEICAKFGLKSYDL